MQVLQAEYNRRVGIERGQHELVCEPIRQRNAVRHEAAALRRQERRELERANEELVLAAEQLHQQKMFEVCFIFKQDKLMTLQREHISQSLRKQKAAKEEM